MSTRSSEQKRPRYACCGSCKCFVTLQQHHFLGKILALPPKNFNLSFCFPYLFLYENIMKCFSFLYEQVNDTVGALSLGYYHDPDTVVAVVFGTGSNACYLERTDAIIKCQGLLTTSGSMVLRIIAWSIFRNQL